jgi:hypothetical protein
MVPLILKSILYKVFSKIVQILILKKVPPVNSEGLEDLKNI